MLGLCTSALLLLCDHSLAVAQHGWLIPRDSRAVSERERCRCRLCHSYLLFIRIALTGLRAVQGGGGRSSCWVMKGLAPLICTRVMHAAFYTKSKVHLSTDSVHM